MSLPQPPDDMVAEYRGLEQMVRKLRQRAGLHHMDPEALDEDEAELLEQLEDELRNP